MNVVQLLGLGCGEVVEVLVGARPRLFEAQIHIWWGREMIEENYGQEE